MTVFSREKPLAAVRWVRVGSVNEPKLAAVRSAFGAYAPDAKIEGVAIASGVSEQPVGFEEVIRGARNRPAPEARVLRRSEIREALPTDHPRMGPDARRESLARRRSALWSRYR